MEKLWKLLSIGMGTFACIALTAPARALTTVYNFDFVVTGVKSTVPAGSTGDANLIGIFTFDDTQPAGSQVTSWGIGIEGTGAISTLVPATWSSISANNYAYYGSFNDTNNSINPRYYIAFCVSTEFTTCNPSTNTNIVINNAPPNTPNQVVNGNPDLTEFPDRFLIFYLTQDLATPFSGPFIDDLRTYNPLNDGPGQGQEVNKRIYDTTAGSTFIPSPFSALAIVPIGFISGLRKRYQSRSS